MQYEYYSILEIERSASESEIKKAYRKKAMECHPDRCGGDKEKEAEFKKVNEAYATLSDPQKKAHYDRFGTTEWMGGFGGFGGGGFDASDLWDIFSQFFTGGFGGDGPRYRADIGADVEIRLKISLEDAIHGVSRKISYKKNALCSHCDGKGGKTETCKTCGGTGQVRERVRTVFGMMEQQTTCSACQGKWETIIETCDHCGGRGYVTQSVEKTIEVPKGMEDGMSIKMRGEGHTWRDGNGDLYITFSVPTEEGGLVRRGVDLHYRLALSPAELTLGTTKNVTIPILGKKHIDIKSWTQHDTEITYRGEWLEDISHWGRTGNLIIHIVVDIPTKISSDQKKLYEALMQSEWGKVKKWWLEELFGG